MTVAPIKQWEDVADLLGPGYEPPLRLMDDAAEARQRIREYLRARLSAVLDAYPGRPTLMLSGGIDSATLAGALQALGADPLCVTVTVADGSAPDRRRGAAVADCLDLDHESIELSRDQVLGRAIQAARDLGTDEIWEVGAAMTTRLAFDVADDRGGGGVLSGIGADVLFAGGIVLDAPLRSNTARLELREQVWRYVQQEFTADRLVPDFYSRVLGEDAHRLVKVFQTVHAWHLTADFGPTVLYVERGTGGVVDKCCLRDLAVEFGVDRDLVWEAKEPLQHSTGIIDALERYGRERMASETAARTYTDPLSEAPEIVIARMGLREALRSEAAGDGVGARDVSEGD